MNEAAGQGPTLKQRAIRYLARREHTRAELHRKLAPYGNSDEIDTVLNDLQHAGLLSDVRFAEAYLRSHGARFGASKLRQSLRAKGVAAEMVEDTLAAADLPDELGRARALWARKFSGTPGDMKEWARQARFLQSRGFSGDVIRRVLKHIEE